MGIKSVRYSRVQPETTVDQNNLATYRVRYDIETDDPEYGPNSVVEDALAFGGTTPLPDLWTAYKFRGDSSPFSFSRSYRVQQNPENLMRWTVEVSYLPLQPGEKEDDKIQPPWDRPAKYSVDREVYSRILEQDIHGWQIVNTAGKMYDEPLEQEASRGVIVIQKNVQTLDQVARYIANYSDAVNKGVWLVGGQGGYTAYPRTALCRDVTSSEIMTEGDNEFYRVTFRIAIKSNPSKSNASRSETTWDRAILERGYQYRGSGESGLAPGDAPPQGSVGWEVWGRESAADRRERLALAAKLTRVPTGGEPVLLDEDGFRLPEGQVGIFTFWETRRQVDFNQLPT